EYLHAYFWQDSTTHFKNQTGGTEWFERRYGYDEIKQALTDGDYNNKIMLLDGKNYSEGDFLTIDGGNGEVIAGKVPTIEGEISEDFSTFMSWADKERRLNIRANADSKVDSEVALKFGAKGIGLCRTEHMFFDPERILAVREMIFAQDKEEREIALQKILPFQREDFISIFKAMNGYPVNIRLLDPPLHEFLPHEEKDKLNLIQSLDITESELEERISTLHEFNPMLGHRGCRLGISYPEIYRVQVRAIIEAAIEVQKNGGVVLPEIMIPLISIGAELVLIKEELEQEINKVLSEQKQDLDYKLGTMIELPRAAITAGSFAKDVDFFSFGTNDLTQTTYGLSRDDAGKFLPEYLTNEIMPIDPFVSIDVEGVGYLVKIACEQGKKVNPDMHLGICGEHGGENKSIQFFHDVGLDYISCSPYRVPVARLAAAQAAIRSEK
ncbi:MAG: pyruvate, phosphate dikinase, partial [Bdellovibrionales bacterium]|nr:pyruvate, phosphate dikinase [Bdellovibrionales bacterium]